MKPQFDLHGKVALVTGASRGIGRQAALTFAEAGADVIVNYRSHADEAEEVAQHIRQEGRRAMVAQCDVADRAGMEAMFAKAAETMGTVDIVVANAAYSVRQPLLGMDWDGFRRTLEVTQYGVFHTCQLAAQQMVRQFHSGRVGGKILIISSVHAERVQYTSAAYDMAKRSINHLGRTMAAELAEYRINVNNLQPGWIDTPGERQFATDEQIREGGKSLPWG
ncbi:MAG: SDR family oxidoreductase, partial [Lentisphaeria bacterium]|nr:SDR family oxidoreductase [Lentisphaeria bacterium]